MFTVDVLHLLYASMISRILIQCILVQEPPLADVFQNKCSWKFRNIHGKTPILKSVFDKVAGLKDWKLQHRCFPVNISKFLRTAFFIEHLRWLTMMMMMMMNCFFCGMVDRGKRRNHCQRHSPSWISNTPEAGFEPVQNLRSCLVEWSFAGMITTTLQRCKVLVRPMLKPTS